MNSPAFAQLLASLQEQDNFSRTKPSSLKGETVSIETITSDQAKKIIKANFGDNRSIIKANMTDLKADMQSGDFHLGTDAIGFDQEDRLVNGQHRMTVLAGLDGHSARFIVVRGLTPKSIQVLDLGKRRMMHDRVTVAGTKMTSSESAIIRNAMVDYRLKATGTEFFCHRYQDEFVKECYERHMNLLREITGRHKKVNSCIASAAFIYCLQRLEDKALLIKDGKDGGVNQKFYGSENQKAEIIKEILDSGSHFIQLATRGVSDVRMAVAEDAAALLLFQRIQSKKAGNKGQWGSKEDLRASIYAAHRYYSRINLRSINSIPQISPFEQSCLVEETNSNDAIRCFSRS